MQLDVKNSSLHFPLDRTTGRSEKFCFCCLIGSSQPVELDNGDSKGHIGRLVDVDLDVVCELQGKRVVDDL